MSLTLENAYGATVVDVTFNLPDYSVSTNKIADGAITITKLSNMGASAGQILKYNGSSWVASDVNALIYAGTWDASIGGSPNPGASGGEATMDIELGDAPTAGATTTLGQVMRLEYDTVARVGINMTNPSTTLDVNGSVQGTSAYSSSSDLRYKENIEVVGTSGESALERILKLDGVFFDWKHDSLPEKQFQQGRDLGVIAQNVKEVFPEAVSEDDQGYFSVAYSKLVAPLIEAVKELFEMDQEQGRAIASLKEEVEEYKRENNDLKDEVKDMKTENQQMKSFLCEKYPDADFCHP